MRVVSNGCNVHAEDKREVVEQVTKSNKKRNMYLVRMNNADITSMGGDVKQKKCKR